MRLPSFSLAAILLVTAAAAHADETPSYRALTADEVSELRAGEVVRVIDRDSTPLRAEVIGLIGAPVDELAAIIIDFESAPEWAPSARNFRLVGTDGDANIIAGETALPMLRNRVWHMRSRYADEVVDGQEAFVYRWNYVPGSGNIEESFGYWLLTPLPEDPRLTYVRYVVHADPGIAFPEAIIAWVTRNALPDLISSLRDRHDELH